MHEASWFRSEVGGSVRCLLCPHSCSIQPESAGLCGVRINRDGILYAAGWGRISALALDPVEKKPLRRFYPGSTLLSVGGWGCNLSCSFCQNWRIAHPGRSGGICIPVAESFEGSVSAVHGAPGGLKDEPRYPADLVSQAQSCADAGNIGLAFTYNEPVINYEYIFETGRLLKARGGPADKLVLVTNGYVNPEPLESLLPLVDAMNIDLKAFTDDFYRSVCGGHLEPVRSTIKRCSQAFASGYLHLEVTTLLIPGYNDSSSEIEALASWLASCSPAIPLHINRHHPAWRMPEVEPVSRDHQQHLAGCARRYLEYVYTSG